MFLCISSVSNALSLKQSVAVVALSQISGLFFYILSTEFRISKLRFFYTVGFLLMLLAVRLPEEPVLLVNRASPQIVLVQWLLLQLLSKLNWAQLRRVQTNLTLVLMAVMTVVVWRFISRKMCSCRSVAGDLYTLQAKAAPPPAGAQPVLEALQLNKLDVNTPCVPDATLQFLWNWMHVFQRCCRRDSLALARFP